jgi:hypothetical protein
VRKCNIIKSPQQSHRNAKIFINITIIIVVMLLWYTVKHFLHSSSASGLAAHHWLHWSIPLTSSALSTSWHGDKHREKFAFYVCLCDTWSKVTSLHWWSICPIMKLAAIQLKVLFMADYKSLYHKCG